MNIAPLFKRFDELADAPERIPALRKVILAYLLHSAVNSPDAISRAATLREAHETRRRELIKSASRKEVPTVSDVVDEDLPPSLSDIPAVLFDRLGNIASIEKGLSQIQSTTPGKYPLVVTAETRSSSDSFDFEGAAAIIPLVSSTGHGDASLKRLHYQEGRYAVGNILAVVKPICADLLRARFIYEYLSAFKEELLVSRMVGTANVSLTVNKLKEVPVPLVSGPVLSRIDELMALCDRLALQQQERETRHAALARASLARFADAPTPANLKLIFHPSYSVAPADLRKSILTLAVQGKLVPQDPNDEPAEDSFPKLASLAVECDDGEFPAHWLRVPLGKMGEWRGGGTPSKSRPEFWKGDLPWVSPKDMKVLHIADARDHISPAAVEGSSVRLVPPGSLLMVVRGMILARAFPVALTIREVTINQDMKALLPSEPKTKEYLLVALRAFEPVVLAAIEHSSHGTCKLKTEFLQDVVMPIPPLAEQRRIVAKVEQLMALVGALETQLAASRATGENLLSALVAELAGTPNNGKVSIPSTPTTGRRGRPRKSA